MRSHFTSVASKSTSPLTAARRTCYWVIGFNSRGQPYARGDRIPSLDVPRGVTGTTSEGARLTGNNQNLAYDSDTIFNPTGFSPIEAQHFRYNARQLSRWVVPATDTESVDGTLKVFNRVMAAGGSAAWFATLVKDFPSFKAALAHSPNLAADIEGFYRKAIAAAADEAAVAAIASPYMMETLEKSFIAPHVQWRIMDALMTTIETFKEARFEAATAREVIERVMKIAQNTIADQPWACEELTDTKTVQLVGDRLFHEGGCW